MTAPPVVRLDGVTRSYPGTPPVEALSGIDLTVGRGEFVAVVGRSGSGKSTLINVVGLLDRPTAGRYEIDGIDTSGLGEPARARLRAERIGVVFQAFHLIEHATALENVMLAGVYNGVAAKRRRVAAERLLEHVGLGGRVSARPDELSGGQRQRVAIARALANEPSLLLADEPTGNLDSATAEAVLDLFTASHRDGATVLMITHDPLVAARAGRVVCLEDGRVAV